MSTNVIFCLRGKTGDSSSENDDIVDALELEVEVVSDCSNMSQLTGKSEIHRMIDWAILYFTIAHKSTVAYDEEIEDVLKGVTYVSLSNSCPVHCPNKHNPRFPSQRSLLGLLSLADKQKQGVHKCKLAMCDVIELRGWTEIVFTWTEQKDLAANQMNSFSTYLYIAVQHV